MNTSERLALIDRMRKTLLDAAEERPKRQNVVEVPGGTEVAWVIFERETMLAAVNAERTGLGLPPVQMQDVAMVEHQAMQVDWVEHQAMEAMGRSDYVAKFALGCADLVVKEAEL